MTIHLETTLSALKQNCHPERSRGICGALFGLPKFWSYHADSTALYFQGRRNIDANNPKPAVAHGFMEHLLTRREVPAWDPFGRPSWLAVPRLREPAATWR